MDRRRPRAGNHIGRASNPGYRDVGIIIVEWFNPDNGTWVLCHAYEDKILGRPRARIQKAALEEQLDNARQEAANARESLASALDDLHATESELQGVAKELEAAQVPRVKDEVAFMVLNGNYAMEAGFSVAKDAVAYEQSDSEAAQTYVNVIAVKEGNENNEGIKALVAALKSDAVKEYINNTYDGGVIPFTE